MAGHVVVNVGGIAGMAIPFCSRCDVGGLFIWADREGKWSIGCMRCGVGVEGEEHLERAIEVWSDIQIEGLDSLVEQIVGGTSNANEGSVEWDEACEFVRGILRGELIKRG